ncbi:hypothetical protein [Streptomyces sp. NPDC020141]|uniref:hypothetical protein n=1 Tax=Streptomyces sp. NPDC020141 TaxID=3365065 RepID=UPI00378E5141
MAEPDFPADLRDAQLRLHQTRAAYGELCRELPWSVEPMPGWEGDKQLHSERIGRMPDSPGYTAEQTTEVARLHGMLLDLAEQVTTHPFWRELRGPELVEARMALKRTAATGVGPAAPAG